MLPAKGFVPPDVFDEYRLVQKLGQGAMGQVYLGHDTLLDRPVAIKFISALDPDPLLRERFLIEARAIARLSHPNVVAIYRVSQVGTWPYLVSEYLRGESLEKLPRPLPWERALEIGLGIAAGLAAAHKRGVLHRDVKPANVMITETGEVKLLDFGLAKLLDALPGPALAAAPRPEAAAGATGAEALAETLPPEGEPEAQARPRPSRPPAPSPRPADLVATRSFSESDEAARTADRDSGAPLSSPSGASLTSAGTMLGTPRYMAPEAWRGEPASGRTDVYSLGAILFELCSGRPPHREPTLAELREAALGRDAPPLRTVAPGVDPDLCEAVDRCLRRDPQERFSDGAELHHALSQIGYKHRGRLIALPEGNPYRGLHAFEAQHRALFFGRSVEIRDLLELLRSEPVVLVAGDSGVGKSSLCRAGVLPHVEEGGLGDGRSWTALRLVPGRRPAQALCEALQPHLTLPTGPHEGEDEALRLLRADPAALWRALQRQLGERRGLLLFLDQAEELVTQSDSIEAAEVAEALNQLEARVPGVRVLLTARGDFLTRLVALPGLRSNLSRAMYLLRPLPLQDLREAIVGPARLRGVRFESEELVDALVESTARARGGLPLLQFALAELWDQRDEERRLIPASALQRIGGVEGALSRHADEVLAALSPAERQAARRLLMRLVSPDGTRARRSDAELCAEGGERAAEDRRALEALVRGRLLFAYEPEANAALDASNAAGAHGGGGVYEVAHEALVQGWGTLRGWLDENADRRAVLQRVERAAAEWERLLRSRDALFGARQLQEAAALDLGELHPREAAFLDASRRAATAQRLRRRLVLGGAPLTLALLYGGFSLKASYELGRQIDGHVRTAKQILGEAGAQDAAALDTRRQALALFDAGKPAEGEERWEAAQKQAQAVDDAYARAGREVETALLLDGQRHPVRRLFADVLYERILLAERARRGAQAEDLRQRLVTYDEDGEHQRRLAAPAALDLQTRPPGAAVRLVRIDRREGRARPVNLSPQPLGQSPLRAELPPGSYVLLLELPGRPPVRYPVLLQRAERLALRVPLPERVPPGFVYVPAGRFLFGSADDDQLRRGLLTAQPLHEVETGAYLIGRTEVTFADWIRFLRALPEPERTRRRPSLDGLHSAYGVNGAVRLEEQGDGGFRLTLQPTARAYVARAGEPIEYPERERRRRQDWLRMPVTGISWEDAEAYLGWLDRSGQVPGARPCDEREWERAARGADDRLYPHGDRLEGDDANIDETYGRRPLAFGPDEVGSHPQSDSPFGVADLAGNVWELTRALGGGPLGRGGGWYQERFSSRSANRYPAEATLRTVDMGLRVCAPAPEPPGAE